MQGSQHAVCLLGRPRPPTSVLGGWTVKRDSLPLPSPLVILPVGTLVTPARKQASISGRPASFQEDQDPSRKTRILPLGSLEASLRAGGGALCAKGSGVAGKERNCAQTRGDGWLLAGLLPGGSERNPCHDVTPETVKRAILAVFSAQVLHLLRMQIRF